MKLQLNKAWIAGDTEVDLFRKMSKILSATYNVTFVEETHQHRISYHSNTINQTALRELSDLWIIAFSQSQKRIRTTFLQAKYHRNNILPTGVFHADYFQYELLSTRPKLLSGSSFNFPADILTFSCCDSIGTYGVFYIDSTKSIDMAYCCASNLNVGSVPTTYGQFSVDLAFPTIPSAVNNCNCDVCSELNYTYDIDVFTDNLLQLNIGAEIQFYPEILDYVKNILRKNNIISMPDLFNLIDETLDFNSGDNKINNENLDKFEDGNPNILIINVDERVRH